MAKTGKGRAFSTLDVFLRKKYSDHMTFTERVLDVVRSIPVGKTLSYQEVAERAGSPRAARAVGTIMKQNYRPDVPCHRVVRADGRPGQYNRGGEEVKRALLRKEHASIV